MQKVLLASTALVFWTGLAAAQEITLSGSAELGVQGGSLFEGDEDDGFEDADLEFHTDIDVTFTMAGSTDSGLTFGANIDLDESGNGQPFEDPTLQGGESIFVSGAFGTLTMGDTDGALDWALSEAIIGASINDDNEHAGFLGVIPIDDDGDGLYESSRVVVDGNIGLDGSYDGQIARYEYAFGDFAVAFSGEIDDDRVEGDVGDPVLGLGFRYATSFGGTEMAFGAGVQTISGFEELADDLGDAISGDDVDDNQTVFGVSADVNLASGVQIILNYSDYDDLGQHYGLAVGYTMDALTVAMNYGQFHIDFDDNVDDTEGFGLIANYDLGGGAELQAGYGWNSVNDEENDTFSFGVAMAF